MHMCNHAHIRYAYVSRIIMWTTGCLERWVPGIWILLLFTRASEGTLWKIVQSQADRQWVFMCRIKSIHTGLHVDRTQYLGAQVIWTAYSTALKHAQFIKSEGQPPPMPRDGPVRICTGEVFCLSQISDKISHDCIPCIRTSCPARVARR